MSSASAKAGGKPQPFTDAEAAAIVVEVERTQKPPDRAVLGRLASEWGDGAAMAQQDGRPGVDRWLKAILGRDSARHAAILGALEAAREAAKDDRDDEPIAGQIEGEHWEEPVLGDRPPAVPFPVDILPPQLADLVAQRAAALNAPIDFVAVSAIATACTVSGRSVALKIRDDWRECAGGYFAMVGPSGMAKSTAIMKMTGPLWAIAKEARQEWSRQKERESTKPKDEQCEIPPLRRVVVDDATVESLGPILQDNPRGIGMVRDELTALVSGMN